MNAAVDEPSEVLVEQQIAGPGERLKQARLAAGMALERVAGQLHLLSHQVEALERDDYSGFAARVFVRGYLRNYARLLALPVDDILGMFDAAYPDPDSAAQLKRIGSHKPQVSSRHGLVQLVSWALLLGIVALFFVWWAGYLELDHKQPPPVANQPSATQPAQQSPGELPPMASSRPSEAAPVEPSAPAIAPAVPETPPAATATDLQPEQPVAPTPEAETAAEPETAASTPSATSPEVVLSLSGNCWVNIRDSSNSFKMIGEYKAGTRRVLEGTPPYRIVLGNAAAASLTIDGQPYSLDPHIHGHVARFSLDPGAQ
jgi:cytoskeleton protein RodZ